MFTLEFYNDILYTNAILPTTRTFMSVTTKIKITFKVVRILNNKIQKKNVIEVIALFIIKN